MKKLLKTGKKTLSVIMAVMMVLSAWVWVAPTEASAAAGSYYVKITWKCVNKRAYDNNYSGYNNRGNGQCGLSLFYKSNNGTGSESEVYWNIGKGTSGSTGVSNTGWMSTTGTYYATATVSGFPTRLFIFSDNNYVLDESEMQVEKIEVGSSSSATLTTLWAGTAYIASSTEQYYIEIKNGSGSGNHDDYAKVTTTTSNWVYPYAKTITWSDTPESMTCPKTASNSAATQTVAVSAKDQYGVQMFDPTWSVKGSNKSDGITVSPTTSSASTTIKVTSSANIAGTTNSQTGTVTATWSTPSSTNNTSVTSSKTFTINDATYTATFKNHRNADGVLQSDYTTTAKYGVTPTAPTASDYSSGDYDYKFTGWNPTVSGITADTTYTATYSNGTFVGADYTEVDKAIAAADAIKANYGTDYELKYTFASRSALNDAINAVTRGLGRTRQSDVDGFAAEINAKIAALDPNKFDVIFLDKDGAILLYEKDVEYKESVAAPDYNEIYYDATNHYTFTGWDTDEYTSVVDDLVIQPVFTAEGHTYTTETVTSNCVTKGATKYTCSCGYSYIDGESDYGDHVWATEFTTDLEPTCTVAGSKSIHCTLCDAQKDITVIPPLGHQWSSQSVAVEATCGKIGIMAKVCDDCGVCEHTIIDALEHDFEEKVVAPTCTTKGYTEYTCKRDNCGYSYRDNYTDVVAHSYGDWETVSDAYCGVEGVKKQTCTECGYVNIGSIDELEHNLSGWTDVVAQTCTGKGYQVKTCSLCGNVIEKQWLDALGHNYVEKTVVVPTCESKGYTVEECNRAECGAQRIVDEEPALNHDWTSTRVEADCTHSAYIEHVCANDAAHNYIEYVNGSTALLHDFTGTETIISPATCTADGKKTVECTRCDATTEEILPKLGHSYGAWDKTTNPATNDKDGTWTRKCENCGDVETLTVPKGGHNLVEDEEQYVAPLCNTKGQRVYKCDAHTDCTVTVTVELDFAQHNVIQEVTTEATCTTKGSVKAYCSDCSKIFSTTEIPEKAHNPVAGEAVAPTCTTSGYTPYACSCGSFSYNLYDASKPATGHDFDETITANVTTVAATCTADGSKTVKCAACEEKNTVVLPKKGHSFVENAEKATAATCTALATKTYECSCGASYVERYGALAAHQFNTLVKTVPATNDSLGYEERKCVCGLTEITILEATGTHVFNEKLTEESVAPTCTENGTDVYKCTAHTDCGAKSSVLVPRLGHTVIAKYTAPTCIAEGSSEAYCTTCNTTVATTVIPVTAHNYSAAVTIPATCEGEGTMTYTCSCGANYTETIPATGHKLSVDITEANCTDGGKVVVTCDNCNDPFVEKTVEFAANGHSWNIGEETVPADCDSEGVKTYTCTLCGATKTETIPANGHSWGDWVVTPSTNDNPGSVSRECLTDGCDATESIEIPAGNHKLVVDDSKSTPATCKAEGKLVYICDKHNDCGITVTVTTAKTQHTVAQREIEATCTKEGSVEAYCSVCNDVLSTEAIPVKAHSYEAQTAVAPTCTTSGYTPYKCSSCGDTYNVYDASKTATGHNLVEGTSTASCIAGGQMTLTCKNCTYSTTVNVPAKGHSYEKQGETVAATCTTPSTEIYKCANCNDTYTKFISGTVDHSWSGWSTIHEATTVSYGIEKRECSVCHTVEHKTTAPTGAHDFEKLSETPATCTQPGSIEWKCKTHTDCEANYIETLDKLPHSQKISYTAPTCIADGSSKIVCENCSTVIKSETISATGCHDFSGEGVTADATCTQTGTITYTCLTDGCTATKVVTIPAKGHSLTTTVTDAKCGEKGSVVTACSRCDYTSTTELAAKGHIWGATPTETVDAKCETNGSETYKCQNCDAENVIVIPATGHTWGAWTVTPSTNTVKGSVSRECTVCDKTESIEIPAGGHELVLKSENKATCENEGTQLYGCKNHTDCGITVTVTTAMLQHTPETETVDKVTCDTDGKVVTSCTECKATLVTTIIPATGHTFDEGVKTDATCTSTGKIVYSCMNADCEETREVILEKLPHDYKAGNPVAPTCTTSGYTPYSCACGSSYMIITAPAKGHSFSEKVSSTADCTTDGVMTLKCACGETMETKVPALGHDYRLNSETDATCAAAATETYKCSRCEASYTISVGDKTKDHDWNDWTEVEKATYTSLGYEIRTCKICGKLEVKTIPATGDHVFDKLISETAPDCENAGEKIYACSVDHNCGLESKVTVPATGHKETISYKAPTCTKDGYTKIICEVEGCTYEKDETPILATGHVYGNGAITAAATCKTAGNIKYTCACGEVMNAEIPVDTSAHKFDTDIQQASCTADGKVTVTCLNGCDYKKETDIPAKGHSFTGEKVTVNNATCTDDGEMTVKCVNCDEVDKVVIPKSGHSMKAGAAVAPTCTTSGYTPYTCGNAGCDHGYNVYDGTKPAKGHTWGGWTIVTAATKDSEGLKRRSCTVCSNATEEQIIPAMKHELTVLENVASTCTKAGHITYKCVAEHDGAACDFTFNVDLPVKQHTLSTAVNDATCVAEGSVVTECTVPGCGYSIVTPIPAIAHKLGTSEHYPSCTDKGYTKVYCENSYCDYEVISEIAPLGHNYDDSIEANVKVEKEATCSSEGLMTVKCSRAGCNEVKEVVIPKLNHVFKEEKTVNATCTESGYILMKCENCTETYNEFVSDPKGHNWNDGEITNPATCTENGEITYTCTNDAKHTYTQPIAKLGHDWGEWKVTLNPTATVEGIQSRECKVCHTTENATIPALGGTTTYTVTFIADGKTVATQIVIHNGKATAPEVSKPYDADYHYSYIWDTDFSRVTSDLTVTAIFTPAAHSYGEWVVDNAASCDNEGLRHRSCACGYVQYETLESTEHSFIVLEGGVPATCTENGFERVECEICHKTEERVLKRLGHVMTYHQAIDPTCDEDGVAGHYSCSRCAKNFKDRAGQNELDNVVVSKRYHTFIVVPGNEATCTKDGTTDYMYCTVCGYNRISETIPAFGHSDANNDGTCDNCGSTYMQGGSIVCSCSCHKNGFFNELIYKILSFFWRLFGTNKSCECGKVHY